jgi:hypothetical protein
MQALKESVWVGKITVDGNFSFEHVQQFDLWTRLREMHLNSDVDDEISWMLMKNGEHSTTSACKAQFLGGIMSNMNMLAWKIWAALKVFFYLASPLKLSLDGRPIGQKGMAKLWPFAAMQERLGIVNHFLVKT